jgi:hypothetical protein
MAAAGGLLLALVSTSSCFNPSFESGRAACGAGGECPSGLTCDPSSRLCFLPGQAPDASIDVVQSDGPLRGEVTVIVVDEEGIAAARPVLFNDPDGTTMVINTDGDGKVVREIGEHTTITSFIRTSGVDLPAILITYFDVGPGETVRVTALDTTEPTPPNATVNFPGTYTRPDAVAADNYSGDFACASTSTNTSPPPALGPLGIRQDCRTPDNTTHVVAYASVAGERAAFSFASGIPVPNNDFTVNLGGWRTDFVVITPTVMNLPADSLPADAGPPPGKLRLHFRAAGIVDDYRESRSDFTFTETPFTAAPVKTARDVFDVYAVTATFEHGGVLASQASFARSFLPGNLAPILDLAEALPPISSLEVTYEADRAQVAASLAGPLAVPDETTALLFLIWENSDESEGAWLVFAPAAELMDGDFTTPTLPAEFLPFFDQSSVASRTHQLLVLRSPCRDGRIIRSLGLENFELLGREPTVPDCVVDTVSIVTSLSL